MRRHDDDEISHHRIDQVPVVPIATSDPTQLTTLALDKEIFHLRELMEAGGEQVSLRLDASTRQTDERFSLQINDIRRQVEAKFAEQDKAVQAALAAADKAVGALEAATSKQIIQTDERFSLQITDIRRQVEAKFSEQDKAVQAALIAADKAVSALEVATTQRMAALQELNDNKFVTYRTMLDSAADKVAAALTAADRAVEAAFASSKEAISKAELFNEKRFDILTKSDTEFASRLASQVALFMPRNEYDARHETLVDQVKITGERGAAGLQGLADRMNALELRTQSRLDTTQGATDGSASYRDNARLNLGAMVAAFGTVLVVVSIVITVVLANAK